MKVIVKYSAEDNGRYEARQLLRELKSAQRELREERLKVRRSAV